MKKPGAGIGERAEWRRLLQSEIRQVIGCTEPACIAYALRTAARHLTGRLDLGPCRATLHLSEEVFRNASTATVPFLNLRGIRTAAAAGLATKAHSLNVFPTMSLPAARRLLRRRGWLRIEPLPRRGLYVRAELINHRDRVTVVIKDRHDQITQVIRNGRALARSRPPVPSVPGLSASYGIAALRDHGLERQAKDFLLHQPWGDPSEPLDARLARLITERMTGVPHAVWTITGSGNQGLFLALPLLELYRAQGRRGLPAVVFALLAQIHFSATRRRISGACGLANKAAPALAAGLAFAQGADLPQIRRVIRSVTRTLADMKCFGARAGCGALAGRALRVARETVAREMSNPQTRQR
jgi:L-cysteine desulfidase